ncbi:MAG: putative toxin-antitoxin system toxin component, PIN family [Burkholderiales bacterium]|nr:putative toxin-antitoxin system toxin component, PIN family [Burkholderiales bacterium]
MATPLCVVFDTNVALALEVFADPRLLGLRGRWDRGELQAIADDDTLAEYERVLRYPELRLDEAAAAAAGLRYRARCTIVPHDSAIQPALPKCRDPDDQKFLQLAQRADASWLLTRDKALLALRKKVRFGIAQPEALGGSGGESSRCG